MDYSIRIWSLLRRQRCCPPPGRWSWGVSLYLILWRWRPWLLGTRLGGSIVLPSLRRWAWTCTRSRRRCCVGGWSGVGLFRCLVSMFGCRWRIGGEFLRWWEGLLLGCCAKRRWCRPIGAQGGDRSFRVGISLCRGGQALLDVRVLKYCCAGVLEALGLMRWWLLWRPQWAGWCRNTIAMRRSPWRRRPLGGRWRMQFQIQRRWFRCTWVACVVVRCRR